MLHMPLRCRSALYGGWLRFVPNQVGPCVERFAKELTTLLGLAAGAQKFASYEVLVRNLHEPFYAQSLQVWHGP